MKKRTIFIIIILLFVGVSGYRFLQLNKSISTKVEYKSEKENQSFNINGVDFKVIKTEFIDDLDEYGCLNLKVFIELYKNGNIVQDGFFKNFPEQYHNQIILNISDKNGKLIKNYPCEQGVMKENIKFAEIIRGERSIGKEKESLILRFSIDKETMSKIKDNEYNVKVVFPTSDNGSKFNCVNLSI